MEAGR